ncbi:MAG: GNAT family N-acetyltransferase [Gammaproteobacteria bacterium]|nr:GNAT family N-acetyltransferase [Gammaproteobacteria bacterium]
MLQAQPVLRNAIETDMPAICEIYADEVLNGVSSWEEQPPGIEQMRRRRDNILASDLPYRVAELDGRVAGYCYASSYRPRSGYRYTVENSIYIDKTMRGRGIGRLLMDDLVAICERQGYRQMVAVIGDANNHVSIDFHVRMGFVPAGVIKSIGFKHGRWMDSVIMQRTLGQGDQSLPD